MLGFYNLPKKTLADDRVIELAHRVSYRINPEDPYPRDYVGWLEVHTRSGVVHHFKQPCMRGGKKPAHDRLRNKIQIYC